MITSLLLLACLTFSPAIALPPPLRPVNRTTAAANHLNLPDPYDFRVGGDLILEVYDYGRPVPFRYSGACVRDAKLATFLPIRHSGPMGAQTLKYTAKNVDLVFKPDVRTTWEDWQAVLVVGLSHFVWGQLRREFQFILVMEGQEDHWGRGWLMLNTEARGLDAA